VTLFMLLELGRFTFTRRTSIYDCDRRPMSVVSKNLLDFSFAIGPESDVVGFLSYPARAVGGSEEQLLCLCIPLFSTE